MTHVYNIYNREERVKTLATAIGYWFFTGIYPDKDLDIAFLYFHDECIGLVKFSALQEEDYNALSKLLEKDWPRGHEPFETW